MEVSSHALELHRVDGGRLRRRRCSPTSPRTTSTSTGRWSEYFAAKAWLFTPSARAAAWSASTTTWGRRLAGRGDRARSPRRPPCPTCDADWRVEPARRGGPTRPFALVAGSPPAAAALGAARATSTAQHRPGRRSCCCAAGVADDDVGAGRRRRAARARPDGAGRAPTATAHRCARRRLRPHPRRGRGRPGRPARQTTGALVVVLGCRRRPRPGQAAGDGRRAARRAPTSSSSPTTTPAPRTPPRSAPAVLAGAREAGPAGPSRARRARGRRPRRRDRAAVALAGPGDTVAVLGKGHETGQEVHGTVHPFDDREELRAALQQLATAQGDRVIPLPCGRSPRSPAGGCTASPATTVGALVVDGPVVTDSREAGPGGLYVARVGESADGHHFVGPARDAGAVAALTTRPVEDLPVRRRRRRPGRRSPRSPAAVRRPQPRPHGHRDHRVLRQDEHQGPAGQGARRARRDRGPRRARSTPRSASRSRCAGSRRHPLPRRRDGRPRHRAHRLPHRDRPADQSASCSTSARPTSASSARARRSARPRPSWSRALPDGGPRGPQRRRPAWSRHGGADRGRGSLLVGRAAVGRRARHGRRGSTRPAAPRSPWSPRTGEARGRPAAARRAPRRQRPGRGRRRARVRHGARRSRRGAGGAPGRPAAGGWRSTSAPTA